MSEPDYSNPEPENPTMYDPYYPDPEAGIEEELEARNAKKAARRAKQRRPYVPPVEIIEYRQYKTQRPRVDLIYTSEDGYRRLAAGDRVADGPRYSSKTCLTGEPAEKFAKFYLARQEFLYMAVDLEDARKRLRKARGVQFLSRQCVEGMLGHVLARAKCMHDTMREAIPARTWERLPKHFKQCKLFE